MVETSANGEVLDYNMISTYLQSLDWPSLSDHPFQGDKVTLDLIWYPKIDTLLRRKLDIFVTNDSSWHCVKSNYLFDKKMSYIGEAVAVIRVEIKWATLASWSTTTKIESKFPTTFGKVVMRSMLMHSHFIYGMSNGWSFLGILTCSSLTFWQVRHSLQKKRAFFFILGQKKFSLRDEYIF